MISPAYVQSNTASESAAMLLSLHERLYASMVILEDETTKREPDMAALANARLKLSRASKDRTALLTDMVDHAIREASGVRLPALLDLQKAISQARSASTAHIMKWSMQSIEADWDGYRAASRTLRAAMRLQLKREAQLLLTDASGPISTVDPQTE